MSELIKISEKIYKANSIAVLTHVRPDGDALGSSSALTLALNKIGKKCEIVLLQDAPKKFSYITKNCSVVTVFDTNKYDLVISVDCADQFRLEAFSSEFVKHKNTVVIDHHISNTRYGDINFVVEMASTCQLIYSLIKFLNVELDKNIATSLYTGLSTDTGNFMHSNTTSEVFSLASELVSFGVNINDICFNVYRNSTFNSTKLLARVLNGMRSLNEGKIILLTVDKKDLEATSTTIIDTEGFIDYALNIDTALVGVSICFHSDNVYKISMRSKGNIDVNEIASRFGGGGHIKAAGCMLNGFFEDVIDKIVYAIGTYL